MLDDLLLSLWADLSANLELTSVATGPRAQKKGRRLKVVPRILVFPPCPPSYLHVCVCRPSSVSACVDEEHYVPDTLGSSHLPVAHVGRRSLVMGAGWL